MWLAVKPVAMFRVQPDSENLATGIVDFDCYPKIELQEAQEI
jgi:lipopolysaccharide transport system ATP-binding protein